MAQNRVAQVIRVYARVASLVVLFLAMTGLLYFLLPAPADPAGAAMGSPRDRSLVHTIMGPQRVDTTIPTSASVSASASSSSSFRPAETASSSSATSPNASPSSSESCPVDQVLQPPASPLPSRSPPRVEHFRASIIVPLLSFNPNITANVGRLLSFLNTTYLSTPRTQPSATVNIPSNPVNLQGTQQPLSASLPSIKPPSSASALAPVEVLLVVDPTQLPISTEQQAMRAAPLPSLAVPQQWDLYRLKRMLKDFQHELRLRDETYLRLLVLSPNASSQTASSSCHETGGDAFGAACNMGAARARGQWLFFLSAETYFEEGWFEEQMRALALLQQPTARSPRSLRPQGLASSAPQSDRTKAKIGLIGCKVLDGPTAERAHSAGLDVALSRREVLLQQGAKDAQLGGRDTPRASQAAAPAASATPAGVKKQRGRGQSFAGSKTLKEWQEMLAKQGVEEMREIMVDLFKKEKQAEEQGEEEAEETETPSKGSGGRTAQTEATSGPEGKQEVVFPYRRLEGAARTDERFNERAEIIAPSSLCFIVDRHIFLNEAKGFRSASTAAAASSASSSSLNTPFLQVLDLSLRLRRDGRRSLYLPTQRAVILNTPEGPWNKEDDTSREDHGLCSSTLFPMRAAGPSPAGWLSYATTSDQSSTPLFPHPLSMAEFGFAQRWRSEMMTVIDSRRQADVELVWDSYGGCTGWGLEAVRFVTVLEPLLSKVAVIADKSSFCKGLPRNVVQGLRRLRSRLDVAGESGSGPEGEASDSVQVWMSHKPPVSYPTFPYKGTVTIAKRPDYVIGRSMVETTAIPADWANNTKRADEIWVPSSFLVDAFVSGGVARDKLDVVPIPIDTQFYSPLSFLSSTTAATTASSAAAMGGRTALPALRPLPLPNRGSFNFLSVFKWEQRKGWDVLLEAYFKEFRPEDNTTLYLHTYLPGTAQGRDKDTIGWRVSQHALTVLKGTSAPTSSLKGGRPSLPRVEVLCEELPEQHMPRLYAAVDAFVLPTRGEGFGMPIMEAMSMGLPTIATNWSGQVDFMNDHNAYPIRVEAMETAGEDAAVRSWGPQATQFAGEWARPSVQHLQQLMRYVYNNREEAKRKGKVARDDIVARYSQAKVAERVVERLKGVERLVRERRKRAAP